MGRKKDTPTPNAMVTKKIVMSSSAIFAQILLLQRIVVKLPSVMFAMPLSEMFVTSLSEMSVMPLSETLVKSMNEISAMSLSEPFAASPAEVVVSCAVFSPAGRQRFTCPAIPTCCSSQNADLYLDKLAIAKCSAMMY